MSGFYVSVLERGTVVRLEGEEFRHATRSLRHRVGERVWLTDGRGHTAEGMIERIAATHAEVRVEELYERLGEPPAPVALVVPPLKQSVRLEWLVEKAVELGATELYFLPMERSVREGVNLSRLQRVALAALKQNLRSVLPRLSALSDWDEVPWDRFPCRLMGEIGSPKRLYEALPSQNTPCLWVVGPEGDFSPQELARLQAQGCQGVSLGTLRLRVETAAVLFLSALKTFWGY